MPAQVPMGADELFVKIWNDCSTAAEAGERMGRTAMSAKMRASNLRKKGCELKRMTSGRPPRSRTRRKFKIEPARAKPAIPRDLMEPCGWSIVATYRRCAPPGGVATKTIYCKTADPAYVVRAAKKVGGFINVGSLRSYTHVEWRVFFLQEGT